MKKLRFSPPGAFTLVELLIALTISGFAMAGIMTLYLYVLQNNFIGEQRLLANDDVRTFASTMVKNARASNSLLLYQSYYNYTPANNTYPFTGTMDASTNGFDPYTNIQCPSASPFQLQNPANTSTLDAQDEITAGNGGSGDYLVFISYTDPFIGYTPAQGSITPTAIGPTQISRLILYWVAPNLAPNDGNTPGVPAETAMYMFDSNNITAVSGTTTLPWGTGPTLPATLSATVTIESLLPPPPTTWTATSAPKGSLIVLNDIRGLAGYIPGQNNGNGLNFINYSNKQNTSVLMRSLILHGNAAKRVTDTYDFTITPGG